MSKSENDFEFRVGYTGFETKDEAVKAATRRALREWETVPVWQKVGKADFHLDKLNPDLVTYSDNQ